MKNLACLYNVFFRVGGESVELPFVLVRMKLPLTTNISCR